MVAVGPSSDNLRRRGGPSSRPTAVSARSATSPCPPSSSGRFPSTPSPTSTSCPDGRYRLRLLTFSSLFVATLETADVELMPRIYSR